MSFKVGDIISFRGGTKGKTYKITSIDTYNGILCATEIKGVGPETMGTYTGRWGFDVFQLVEAIDKKALLIRKVAYLRNKFEEKQKLATLLKQKLAQDAARKVETSSEITLQSIVTNILTASPAGTEQQVTYNPNLSPRGEWWTRRVLTQAGFGLAQSRAEGTRVTYG